MILYLQVGDIHGYKVNPKYNRKCFGVCCLSKTAIWSVRTTSWFVVILFKFFRETHMVKVTNDAGVGFWQSGPK